MSEVYIKEPATKGSAVFHTTHGDLEMELWATECPKACRNFCQLILEGYYNDTIFHRVIKDFIIQGGDKTGTGEGSESVYGEPYPDEIHPRLKFRYRGMMGVASAGAGSKTNGSQFFIVMDRAPSLDRKHTLFGKIVGQTIYNLVRLTEVEVDKNDTPVDPPKIIRAELTWDPFGDLEPRYVPAPMPTKKGNEKHRREPIKNKRVLSFGADEAEDSGDDEAPKSLGTPQSAHDKDPRLRKDAASSSAASKKELKRPSDEPIPSKPGKSTPAAAPPAKVARRKAAASESDSGSEKGADYEEHKSSSDGEGSSGSSRNGSGGPVKDSSQKRNEQIAKLKKDIVSARTGEAAPKEKAKPQSAWEQLLAGFKTRGQAKSEKPRDKKARQAEAVGTVREMKCFKERVRDVDLEKAEIDAPAPEVKAIKEAAEEGSLAAVWEEGDDESTAGWLSGGGLSFKARNDEVYKVKTKKQRENLEIFDPLAAANEADVLEAARQRRSDQMKPSLRRKIDAIAPRDAW